MLQGGPGYFNLTPYVTFVTPRMKMQPQLKLAVLDGKFKIPYNYFKVDSGMEENFISR